MLQMPKRLDYKMNPTYSFKFSSAKFLIKQPTNRSISSSSLKPKLRVQKGFTLIEVMVALAILAMVAVVASQASGTYLRSVDNLKTRTLGHFVAQNTAAMLQINPQWLQSPQVNKVSEQGREWQVTLTPVSLTEVFDGSSNNNLPYAAMQESIRPLSIQVAPITTLTEGGSGEVQHSITDLTIMISKPDEQ